MASSQDQDTRQGAGFDPIPRRKLYHEIVERLLERIVAGEFRPGDKLPSERNLMEIFQVGRPAVREAMLTLQRMGVIAISHGERARILAPNAQTVIDQIGDTARHVLATSPASLDHLKSARLFFERGMVRVAAERAGAAEIARLRAAVAAHRAAIDDTGRFLACDMDFHRTIAGISGNPIFEAVSRAMLEWLAKYYVEMVRVPGSEPVTVNEHERICDAIAAHDPDAAEQAMSDHLNRANALYRRLDAQAHEE